MIVKLLTEYYLAFLSLKGGCRGSSEPTHVHRKSQALAQLLNCLDRVRARVTCDVIFVALSR